MVRSGTTTAGKGQPLGKGRWVVVGLFALALAVRLVYLAEASGSPTFSEPVVDAGTYDAMARSLAEGNGFDEQFFWQPFFYPVFLAGVYYFSNGSILCAKLIQVLLGSIVCVLTYRLGTVAANRRTGLLAGVIVALWGPLVFFDCELLATGWASFWAVSLILLALRAQQRPSRALALTLGGCGGLAVLTRPTFLPFLVVCCLWTLLATRRASLPWKEVLLLATVGLIAFACVLLPVAGLSYHVTNRFSPLPASGPINLYIGNNPDAAQTVAIRPGAQWEYLVDWPKRDGEKDEGRFFVRRVRQYVLHNPVGFLKGLARKAGAFISSREIPRNVHVYLARKYSRVLTVLTWKAGHFGVPFGLLLPLAVVGLTWRRPPMPSPVYLFLLLYPLAVILVFVSARYRAPVAPVLAVSAAAGAQRLIKVVRARHWRSVMTMACVIALAVAASLPGPLPGEAADFEGEMYHFLGERKLFRGQFAECLPDLTRALELNPRYATAHAHLGLALLNLNRPAEAIEEFRTALGFYPYIHHAHLNWGTALVRLGKVAEAVKHYRLALQIKPWDASAYRNLGNAFLLLGQFDKAIAHHEKALAIDPGRTGARSELAIARHFRQREKAVRADPTNVRARLRLARDLLSLGSVASAAEHARKVVALRPRLIEAHLILAETLVRDGKLASAVARARTALSVSPESLPALDRLAWYLATLPDAHVRNGREAARLARQACDATGYKNAGFLDTLAAAYAENGQFEAAARIATRAIKIAGRSNPPLAEQIRRRRACYVRGKPYHRPDGRRPAGPVESGQTKAIGIGP